MQTVFKPGNPDGIESEMAADIFLDWTFWMAFEVDFPLDWQHGTYAGRAWLAPAVKPYVVKCHNCKRDLHRTDSRAESAAGRSNCEACR